MKLNKFALTLTAAALLPTLAYAGTDEVVASFERDLQRGIAAKVESVAITRNSADPLVNAISTALYGTNDPVLASFERDLYRDPITPAVMIAGAADPLVNAISVALYGTNDPVLASFERDLYREPVNSAVVFNNGADPLQAINVALWKEIGDKPVVHAASAANHRRGG